MPTRLLQFIAPDLENLPVAGVGCCGAVAPDDLARGELNSWPGVRVQSLDVDSGVILVALAEEAPAVVDLLDALRDLGVEARVDEDHFG